MIDLPALPDPLLIVRDAQPMADSRVVAKAYDRKHFHLLDSIRDLLKKDQTLESSFRFEFDQAKTGNGGMRQVPYCLMDEEGFLLLVMGFNTVKALAVKRKFIAAFRAMRDLLNLQRDALHERMRDWELRERESLQRGSVAGKALNVRRCEKPALEGERRSILDAVQLTLKLGDKGLA